MAGLTGVVAWMLVALPLTLGLSALFYLLLNVLAAVWAPRASDECAWDTTQDGEENGEEAGREMRSMRLP